MAAADDKKVFDLNDLKASVAMLDLSGKGLVDMSADSIFVQANVSVENEPVKEVTAYFGDNYPVLKKLDTDAAVTISASCEGFLDPSTGKLPEITARILVPDSKISWQGIEEKGRFDLEATATYKDGILSAKVPDLSCKINGADIDLKGSSNDLMSIDPLLKVDSKVHLLLDSLMRFLPAGTDINARGNLDGNLKGSFRLSQLDLYNFDKIGIQGNLSSNGL